MTETLGKRLKERRKELGISLRFVEGKTGVSNVIICQMESGHIKRPSFRNVVKLAKFYQLDLDDLAKLI